MDVEQQKHFKVGLYCSDGGDTIKSFDCSNEIQTEVGGIASCG